VARKKDGSALEGEWLWDTFGGVACGSHLLDDLDRGGEREAELSQHPTGQAHIRLAAGRVCTLALPEEKTATCSGKARPESIFAN